MKGSGFLDFAVFYKFDSFDDVLALQSLVGVIISCFAFFTFKRYKFSSFFCHGFPLLINDLRLRSGHSTSG